MLLVRVLGALAAVWALASVWFPFGWDHGILASVGDAIVRGGMPYRDAWDMKGPLAFYAFALAEWMFGRNMWGIRILDLALLTVASVVLARMVARITSRTTGLWAAVAFVLWYGSLTWFFVSQPDGWVGMAATVAAAPFVTLQPRLSLGAMAWSGLLVGACAAIKPFYAAFLLVPAAFVLTTNESKTRRASAVGVAVGAAMVPVLMILAWFAYRHALDTFLEVHVAYASAYADSMRPDLVIRRIVNYFWINGVPTPAGAVAVLLPAIGLGAAVLWRERRQLALVLLTWLGVALFCVALQGKFWFYQWTPSYAPFIVLAAFGLHSLTDRVPTPAGRLIARVSAALFMVQIMVVPAIDVARWTLVVARIETLDSYYSHYARRNYVASHEIRAAHYVRQHTSDSDTVLVWGNDATIPYLSGRRAATRFVFAMPLTRDVRGPFRSTYRNELLAQLEARPPRYVVIGQPHDGSDDKRRDIAAFPELLAFIESRYRLEHQIGFLDLYRRLD